MVSVTCYIENAKFLRRGQISKILKIAWKVTNFKVLLRCLTETAALFKEGNLIILVILRGTINTSCYRYYIGTRQYRERHDQE